MHFFGPKIFGYLGLSAAFDTFSPRRIFHSATLWRETLILKRCDRWRELFFQKCIKMCLWLPPGRISHATKTGRDTRGASPFGSQKTRVGDVDASAQDESNAKTPVQKFKKRRLQIRKDSRSRFRLRVPYFPRIALLFVSNFKHVFRE